jgi:hypothetical protein
MDDNKNIKILLCDISNEITELENEKNLGKIVKSYNKLNNDLKNTNTKIQILKQNFEQKSDEKQESKDNKISLEIKEDEYLQFANELSEEEISKIINCDDLEVQIEDYKKMLKKLNLCKEYLESKKMNIIECDKEQDKKKDKDKDKEKNKDKDKDKDKDKEQDKNKEKNKYVFKKKNYKAKQNSSKNKKASSSDTSEDSSKKIKSSRSSSCSSSTSYKSSSS